MKPEKDCGSHDCRLVDDDDNDVEEGQPGELIVKGDIVTNGYYK